MPFSLHAKPKFHLLLSFFCLANFSFWLWACYPGVLYGDNIVLMTEAFPGGGIGDQHSVMYSWLLRICYATFGQGVGYPLIWGLFFWHAGVFLFSLGLYRLYESHWALAFAIFFLDSPFIVFVFPHMQLKDFAMSAVLFSACGLLFLIYATPSAGKNMKRGMMIALFFLFFLALSFRHNAIFAFVPITLLIATLLLKKFNVWSLPVKLSNAVRLILVTGLISIGMFLAKAQFDKIAGDYQNYFVHACIFSFDLAGISVQTGEMQIPQERLMPGITFDSLQKVFTPRGWDPLWGGWGSSPRIISGIGTQEEYAMARNQWLASVRTHPGAYLNHRNDHFMSFKREKNTYLCICEWTPEASLTYLEGNAPPASRAEFLPQFKPDDFRLKRRSVLEGFENLNQSLDRIKIFHFLFFAFPFYLVEPLSIGLIISAVLAFLAWRRPERFTEPDKKLICFATVIFASGMIYFLSYYFISVSSDWRYIHWSTLSFWIGLSLLIPPLLGRLKRKRA